MARRLTLIAGSGALVPHLVAAVRRGSDPIQILSLTQSGWSPGAIPVSLRDAEGILAKIQAFGTTHLALAGAVDASDADREVWLRVAGHTESVSAGDSALSVVAATLVRGLGLDVVGAHELAPDLIAPRGRIGGPQLDAVAEALAAFALKQARLAGGLDLGQALVLSGRRVVAAEDIEGTDALLRRVKSFRERGLVGDGGSRLVLAKAKKPGQPDFVDLPAIGPDTVANAAAAGIGTIVVEAGQTLLLNRAALAAMAEQTGVSVIGLAADG